MNCTVNGDKIRLMLPEMGTPIFIEEAEKITDEGERDFALACINSGCLIFHQVAVNESVIDFLIINPKNPTSIGKLVEVTREPREDIYKKHIKKGKGRHAKRVVNTTGIRKQRQIENMKDSGLPWTILCQQELNNLKQRH